MGLISLLLLGLGGWGCCVVAEGVVLLLERCRDATGAGNMGSLIVNRWRIRDAVRILIVFLKALMRRGP